MKFLAALLAGAVSTAAVAQTLPPRDPVRRAAPPRLTATASIEGWVFVDDPRPKPLRRARVTATSAELPGGRTVITHDDGSYRIDGLPAGRYIVRAVKDGYVPMSYGAKRTSGNGTSVLVRERQARKRTDIGLPRGAVLSGRLLDADGQPAAGVPVAALARHYVPAFGEFTFAAGPGRAITDDRGEYRIFGLPPGQYLIAATPPEGTAQDLQVLSEAEVRRAIAEARQANSPFRSRPGFAAQAPAARPAPPEPRRSVLLARAYFPGTTQSAHALPVSVGRGEERAGLDFVMDAVPTGGIRGFVLMPDAGDVPIEIRLVAAGSMHVADTTFRQARVRNNGEFSFARLPPGIYNLSARPGPAPDGASHLFTSATVDVAVEGETVEGVALVGQPNVPIEGRLVFDGAAPPVLTPRSSLPLPLVHGTGALLVAGMAAAEADGRFSASATPGSYRLLPHAPGIRQPIGRWFLSSVTVAGVDLLDRPIDLRNRLTDVVVTFTDRPTELSGRLVAADGDPGSDCYVVFFSTSRDTWFPGSRRVAGVHARDDGTYSVRNLPPGTYWAVAVADMEEGEWNDPALLDRLSDGAVRVTLAPSERKLQDLRVK